MEIKLPLFRYFNLYGLFVFLTTIYLFNVISLANITACEVLTYYDTLNVNEYLRRFQVTMQAFGMHDLYRKILENITRMYQFDGIMYMYGAKIYKNVPPGLFQIVRNFTLRELIESVKIFANCDSKIISDVALRVSVSIYDKNELITVEGETHLQMLVIVHGYCVYYSKERQRILGK